jgi:hypothetical protein
MNTTPLPTCRIQTVTPDLAAEWLQHNTSNRALRRNVVAGYVDEMRAGRWRLVSDAIGFDPSGELINGQHRLTAVVESGVTCTFLVMHNCPAEAKDLIDLGCSRTVADTLRMMYGIDRASMITGAIRILDAFVDDRDLRVTVGHALGRWEAHADAFHWITHAMPGRAKFSSSPVVAALVFAHRRCPPLVEEFTSQLVFGNNLDVDCPALVCRNRILDRGGAGTSQDEKHYTFLLVLTAIQRHLEGLSGQRLRITGEVVDYFAPPTESERGAAA